MKPQLLLLFLLGALQAFSQTTINKSVAVQAGQKLTMHFEYSKVKVSTWDKNEIAITGIANINEGENDSAFVLETSSSGNEVTISETIKGLKNLPQHITIRHNGKKIIFKTKADYEAYTNQNGRDFNYKSWGTDIDIVLEIKVPKNVDTKIFSVYGILEIIDFNGPIVAESTYGGVDASLKESAVGDLKAVTDFGQIFTNLNHKFTGGEEGDFHTVVSAKMGSGPRYSFESKYGNVYLRKAL